MQRDFKNIINRKSHSEVVSTIELLKDEVSDLNYKMEHRDFWISKREGDKLSASLNNWKLQADQFYRGSECIFREINADYRQMVTEHHKEQITKRPIERGYMPQLYQVYFLLIGYCLENMIKGVLIFNNPALVSGNKLPGNIKTHNLGNLSKLLKIEFTDEEDRLFNFLTSHIEWYSKYPIPAKASDSIGSSGHTITAVRTTFKNIYKKTSIEMQSTGSLKDHLHNYLFDGE